MTVRPARIRIAPAAMPKEIFSLKKIFPNMNDSTSGRDSHTQLCTGIEIYLRRKIFRQTIPANKEYPSMTLQFRY